MSLFFLVLVAIVQGLTEFLPVSSSGHLILLPKLVGVEDQGLVIDVAVHVGTLGAVIVFFRQEVRKLAAGLNELIGGTTTTDNSRFALSLVLSTVPVVAAGLVLKVTGLVEMFRSVALIGWTMIVFGLLLYWADQRGPTEKTVDQWSLRDAMFMGLWQAVALVPGTSRSGITITASRMLGYRREDGARIAMMMSIPTIMASGLLLGADAIHVGNTQSARDGAIGAAFAFVAAYLALAVMMRLLRSVSYTPYVIYRIILGAVLLWVAYS